MQVAIAYELTAADGARAVVGNCNEAVLDPDFVGYLDPENGITGLLDGAEVRENAQAIVLGDGGEQGPQFLGLRPGTIQGFANPNLTIGLQEDALARLKRASRALRADAMLRWTPADGYRRRLRVRRSARPSIGGRRPKTFQIALSSPDPYVLSDDEQSLEIVPGDLAGELGIPDPVTDPVTSDYNVAAQQYASNIGDAETWPRFRLDGPLTNPQILNQTTGQRISLGYVLGAGEWLAIYPRTATILLNGDADRYEAYDFDASEWWQLRPGLNDVRLLVDDYDAAAGARLTAYWRHAWE